MCCTVKCSTFHWIIPWIEPHTTKEEASYFYYWWTAGHSKNPEDWYPNSYKYYRLSYSFNKNTCLISYATKKCSLYYKFQCILFTNIYKLSVILQEHGILNLQILYSWQLYFNSVMISVPKHCNIWPPGQHMCDTQQTKTKQTRGKKTNNYWSPFL